MDRVTYAYQKLTSVSGGDGILSAINTFAVAQGWTATYYQTNKSWDDEAVPGYYDWGTEGTLEDHLELYSDGYGSQDLRFRFRNIIQSGTENRIQMRAIDPAYPSLDHTTSTYPTDQHDWTYTASYSYISVPAGSFPEMALVGNDKVIMVFLFVNSFTSYMFAFGSYELIPEFQDTDQLQMHFHPSNIVASGSWENLSDPDYTYLDYWYSCFYQLDRHTWWEDARSEASEGNFKLSARVNKEDTWAENWSDWSALCCINSFSGFRTFVSMGAFGKDSDAGTWNHVGHLPTYIIPWAGLEWGELITRGDDSYIVFPMFYVTQDFGVAIKVST
jgi:hypothetical protein